MEETKQLSGLIGPEESTRILGALERGVTRREILKMLVAGGMQATLAGGLATTAMSAHAQTPRKGGRITVAGSTAAVTDTLDPAKQSNGTDYVRGFMFYNGLTYLDGSLTPQPQLAEEFTTKDAKIWVFKLRPGVTFPRRSGISSVPTSGRPPSRWSCPRGDRFHRDRDEPAARGAPGRCQLRHAPRASGRLLGAALDEAPGGIRPDPAAPLR